MKERRKEDEGEEKERKRRHKPWGEDPIKLLIRLGKERWMDSVMFRREGERALGSQEIGWMESVRIDKESCEAVGVQGVSLWVQGRLKFHNKVLGEEETKATPKTKGRDHWQTDCCYDLCLSSRKPEITCSYRLCFKYQSSRCLRSFFVVLQCISFLD